MQENSVKILTIQKKIKVINNRLAKNGKSTKHKEKFIKTQNKNKTKQYIVNCKKS